VLPALTARALGPVDAIGVGVVGDHNKFVVGEDASITAVYGIWGPASHTDVINHGAISAIVLGIGFDASADIRNFGTVSAVIGIMGGHGTRIFNGEDGRIVGYDVGVEFIGGHDTLIKSRRGERRLLLGLRRRRRLEDLQ
jgi:hypothetical protein